MRDVLSGVALGSFAGGLAYALVGNVSMTVFWTGVMISATVAAKDVDKKTESKGDNQ